MKVISNGHSSLLNETTTSEKVEEKRLQALSRRISKRLKEESWVKVLGSEFEQTYFRSIVSLLSTERKDNKQVFPPEELIFNAFNLCPLFNVKVVLLGQDPYHGPGQAMGLSFSVPAGVTVPPSLKNMFKELQSDIPIESKESAIKFPKNGNLEGWAQQGVLLLNTVLTVRAHQPDSHAGVGWEKFTDAAIKAVNNHTNGVVFLLWGAKAQKKKNAH